jgi:dipeptide transport system substrate-binding protein
MRGLKISLLLAALAAPQLASALVFCSEGSPAGFDPALYTTSTVFDASAETLFSRLVEFKKGRTELQPGLAEFWNVSEDGKVYTFHLRRGVAFHSTTYFHPSRPLEAADVVFTFERMLDKSLPFNKAFPATFPYFDSMGMREDIVGVRAVDAQTVEFKLRHRNAPFLQNLAMSFASIQSAEYAAALLARGAATELDTRPIGTGPFQFVGYEKDRSITYKAFGGYWNRGEIKIDSLVFLIE